MSQMTSLEYPNSSLVVVIGGTGSSNPAPVTPVAGKGFFLLGFAAMVTLPLVATVADFHEPHILVGGIGVGGTTPQAQSPERLFRLLVISVTNNDGCNGRPLGSLAAHPTCGLATHWAGVPVGLGVGATPQITTPFWLTVPSKACSSL